MRGRGRPRSSMDPRNGPSSSRDSSRERNACRADSASHSVGDEPGFLVFRRPLVHEALELGRHAPGGPPSSGRPGQAHLRRPPFPPSSPRDSSRASRRARMRHEAPFRRRRPAVDSLGRNSTKLWPTRSSRCVPVARTYASVTACVTRSGVRTTRGNGTARRRNSNSGVTTSCNTTAILGRSLLDRRSHETSPAPGGTQGFPTPRWFDGRSRARRDCRSRANAFDDAPDRLQVERLANERLRLARHRPWLVVGADEHDR